MNNEGMFWRTNERYLLRLKKFIKHSIKCTEESVRFIKINQSFKTRSSIAWTWLSFRTSSSWL